MLAILNSLNAHCFPIFQPPLMILVSKFMVQRALFDKTYLSLGLLSPLIDFSFKPRSHIHGFDAGLAKDTILHHPWQSVLVPIFPYCICNHT